MLCAGTELWLCAELLCPEVLPQALRWLVPPSLLPQELLCSRLRAELLCAGADLLCSRAELWLCAELLCPEALPQALWPVSSSLLPQKLLCSLVL